METETSLLILPISSQDKHNVLKGLSDIKVTQYYDVHYSNLDEVEEQMQWYNNLVETKTGQWFAIKNQENTFFGAIGFNNVEKQTAEIGFWLLPQFFGKGIMKKALPLALHFAENNLKLNSIIAYVDSKNTACITFLQRNNFVKIESESTNDFKFELAL